MSNKKRTGKYEKNRKSGKRWLWLLVLAAVVVIALSVVLLQSDDEPEEAPPTQPTETTAAPETTTEATITLEENSVNLGYGIYVTDMGAYTGMYMEDGSDEILSGILMMIVKNDGDRDIQYAQITMDIGETQAVFTATTIPVGESMVLLEQTRMTWDETVDYESILPKVETIAYFQEQPSTHADKFKIQIIDGALNVTNISGQDIAGKITVYYKNAAEDLLYGGITYSVSIEGGLKADELRQVMTNHASDTGSRIMFVTIAE